MAGQCKYEGCEVDDPQPPYRYKRDGIPSVTAISGMIDLGKASSFGYAASLIAATTAVHEIDRWSHLSTDNCTHTKDSLCSACRFLRGEHKAQWDRKAVAGTHVHHLVNSLAEGQEVDQDDVTEPYLNAFEAFVQTHNPDWVLLERTVAYDEPRSHSYRGKFDVIATLDCPLCPPAGDLAARCNWMCDWKTGRYYPVEQTLQLSAYRQAKHLTRWDDKTEVHDGPVPPVAHAGVVLLGDDGTFRLAELPANGDAFGSFLRLRDVWGWHRTMTKWIKDNPIVEIGTSMEMAA